MDIWRAMLQYISADEMEEAHNADKQHISVGVYAWADTVWGPCSGITQNMVIAE